MPFEGTRRSEQQPVNLYIEVIHDRHTGLKLGFEGVRVLFAHFRNIDLCYPAVLALTVLYSQHDLCFTSPFF